MRKGPESESFKVFFAINIGKLTIKSVQLYCIPYDITTHVQYFIQSHREPIYSGLIEDHYCLGVYS